MNVQKIRKQALERDNYTCQTCLSKDKKLDTHHIIPKRLGGLDVLNNIFSICRKCHRMIEFRSPIVRKTFYNENATMPLTFWAKVSRLNEEKYLIIIPKQYSHIVERLYKKQVRMTLEDEL